MSRHGLICRLRPATIRCTAICAVRKAGCSPGLFLLPERGGRGRNAIRATDRQTGQTEELSALQSRENGRDRAVPPLPLQTAGAHAPAAARHRTAGGVDRRQRLARRRELLRRPLQVNPGVRRGTLAIIPAQWSSSTDLPAVHFTTRPSRVLTQTSFASPLLALVK